jgi:uncharacterized protein
MAPDDTEDLRTRMRRALVAAMKARDERSIAALRSALAAIDNAEAVSAGAAAADSGGGDREQVEPAGEGHPAFAGTVQGLGAGEVERRNLTAAEMETIVRAEMAEREIAAGAYERAGHAEHAIRLRGEAEVLSAYLGEPGSQASGPASG